MIKRRTIHVINMIYFQYTLSQNTNNCHTNTIDNNLFAFSDARKVHYDEKNGNFFLATCNLSTSRFFFLFFLAFTYFTSIFFLFFLFLYVSAFCLFVAYEITQKKHTHTLRCWIIFQFARITWCQQITSRIPKQTNQTFIVSHRTLVSPIDGRIIHL